MRAYPSVARPSQDAGPSALALLVDAGFVVVPISHPKQRPPEAVPVVDLLAAAGALGGAPRVVDTVGWTVLARRAPPPAGHFVAQVRGGSMSPRVPDGAVCLFAPPPSSIQGRIALVEHEAIADADLGGSYALKKVAKLEQLADGRTRVVLRSLNPAYAPVTLYTTNDDTFRVVAEFVKVLVRP